MLTGLSDVWSALRDRARGTDERSGLLLMVVSAAAFALMAAFAKWLLPDAPTQAVVFSRGVLLSIVLAAWARARRVPLAGRNTPGLILRGLLGYAALSCYFWSVQHLPLGDAVLLQYSHPAFVAAAAPFALGERTGRWHWPLIAAALVGVAMIVGATGRIRGAAVIGLIGAMLSGLAYLAVRKLSRSEHPITIMVWFPLVTVVPAALATWRAGAAAIPKDAIQVAGHLAVSASALLGQIALTLGLTRVRAARATAVTMTGPVFGALYGFVLFGTVPTAASVAGTVVVIAAVVLLARLREPAART